MGKCRMKEYRTNEVVTHGPLICYGGFGQPRCAFLKVCMKENGLTRTKLYGQLVNSGTINAEEIIHKTREIENLSEEPNEGLEGFPQEHI